MVCDDSGSNNPIQLVVDVCLFFSFRVTGVNTFRYCGHIPGIVYVSRSFHRNRTNWRPVLAVRWYLSVVKDITTVLYLSTLMNASIHISFLCHDEWDDFSLYSLNNFVVQSDVSKSIVTFIFPLVDKSLLGVICRLFGCGPLFAIGKGELT